MRRIKTFLSDDQGATAVEYALIIAIMAVAITIAIASLVTPIGTLFQGPADAIRNAFTPGG
jgi:pilus assembly protein Flp/PilA